MTTFVFIAAILVAVGLAWLLPPLLRREPSTLAIERAAANLGILKDQLAELEAERARGAVSAEQYAEARAELERRVLEDVAAPPEPAPAGAARSGRATAVVIALVVPIAAGLIYWQRGDFAAFDPALQQAMGEGSPHDMAPAEVERIVGKLAERLKQEPDNAEGWLTLARTYYVMRRFSEAVQAYETLVKLVPDDPGVLADYADALAMARGRKISGEPMTLVKKALAIDPNQWKALAMAGTEAFDRKDYKTAVEYWERLRNAVPAESEIAKSIAGSIAEARELGGLKQAPVAAAPQPAAPAAKPPAAASAAGSVAGSVDLAPALKAKARPDDVVFIFARAAEGPRMPLAIVKVQVKDLPVNFVLDDAMAMSPNFKLSSFPEVVVGARVSKTGGAMPASGDLEGLSKPVKVGARGIAVTIDRIVP
ncbi:MAG: c-type cytochrome biogenesis protein CcmI [Burkholderiaceae bacterium]